MATNYVQRGLSITITAPSGGVVSGQALLVGSMFGVCMTSAPSGSSVEMETEGVWTLPSDGSAWTVGELCYWNATNGQVTATSSGNTKIGVSTVALASGGSTATVRLNGAF